MLSVVPSIAAAAAALLLPSALAQGMYSRSSPVLQVDGSNYHDLIAKSNHTSIVEWVNKRIMPKGHADHKTDSTLHGRHSI